MDEVAAKACSERVGSAPLSPESLDVDVEDHVATIDDTREKASDLDEKLVTT
jgi:hypothetical protein